MDYTALERSNWFHVDDVTFLDPYIDPVDEGVPRLDYIGTTPLVDVDRTDNSICIACEGTLVGIADPGEDEGTPDAFYKLIQQHLVDGDAAVIMHIGHEGLRYLDAGMTAITKSDVRMFSMAGAAEKGVRHFLDDENWKLVM